MYGYIYRITDLANGKCYIGQHKYDKPMLDPKYHGSSRIIKNQIRKHPENFLEEIIFIAATLDELNYFETYFIKYLNTIYPNGYNLNTGGCAKEASDATRAKLSEIAKNRIFSEESRRKRSEASKGEKNHFYGKHHTEESKRKNRESKLKYRISKEELYDLYIVQRLSQLQIANLYGCSQDTVFRKLKEYRIKSRNNSEANKGRVPWNKGKQMSDEQKQKQSDYMKSHPNSGQFQNGQAAWNKKWVFTGEELYDLYIVQGLSIQKIADLYKCHRSIIVNNLKKFNISKSRS